MWNRIVREMQREYDSERETLNVELYCKREGTEGIVSVELWI